MHYQQNVQTKISVSKLFANPFSVKLTGQNPCLKRDILKAGQSI